MGNDLVTHWSRGLPIVDNLASDDQPAGMKGAQGEQDWWYAAFGTSANIARLTSG